MTGLLLHWEVCSTFLKVAKTTMNISELEINKSRINIYAPKGMRVVFMVSLKYLIPVTAEKLAPATH